MRVQQIQVNYVFNIVINVGTVLAAVCNLLATVISGLKNHQKRR